MAGMDWAELGPIIEQIGQRLESLETQMALVSEKVGLVYAPMIAQVPQQVIDLARAGRTLEAITQYRAATGASLADARAVVLGL
jgi:hypothetical protein